MPHTHHTLITDIGLRLVSQPDPETACRMLIDELTSLAPHLEVGIIGRGHLSGLELGVIPAADITRQLDPEVGAPGVATRIGDRCVHVPLGAIDPIDDVWHAELWACRELGAGPIADEELAIIRSLAAQVSLAIDIVLTRVLHVERERQLKLLVDTGIALSEDLELDSVLRKIVDHACVLVGARYGALGVLSEDGRSLDQFITVGVDDQTRATIGDLPTGRGLLGVLMRDPRPLRIDRIASHPESVGFPAGHPPMGSFLGVPIVTRGAARGRLYLTEKIGFDEFSADDERLAQILAAQAAIALDNATLYEQVTETVGMLEDANRRLEEADHHKRAFLANVSHELRSPLNTILGYTRLLLDDAHRLDEEQVTDLGIIAASGTHLLRLISDLLDLSRIEAGRMDLRLEEIDATLLSRDVIDSVRPQVAAGVDLVLDVEEGILLTCDRARVRQMLLNLMGNAIKFTDRGAVTLFMASDAAQDTVRFEIRDTGPGIPAADLERIFESFFQSGAAQSRTPRAQEGAGLGLAITRMLTELHGGTIDIESSNESGTCVSIVLPRRPRRGEEQSDAQQ